MTVQSAFLSIIQVSRNPSQRQPIQCLGARPIPSDVFRSRFSRLTALQAICGESENVCDGNSASNAVSSCFVGSWYCPLANSQVQFGTVRPTHVVLDQEYPPYS